MMEFELLGMGLATGDVVTSDALDARLGLDTGTVAALSGVNARYFVPEHISQSAFAAAALRHALSDAEVAPDSLDLLLCTSAVPEQAIPSTACLTAHELGLSGTPAFDINASCLGFVVSLNSAIAFLNSGSYQRIGLVASDLASRGLNWQTLHAAAIFGDGAAAVVIQARPQAYQTEQSGNSNKAPIHLKQLGYRLETYPEGRYFCEIRAGGTRANATVGMSETDFYFDMDGKAVFRLAMQHTERFVARLLADAELGYDDIDTVVLHQASHLGMKHAIARLKFRPDSIIDIYATHGNQVSASIPTVLYHAYRDGRISRGKKIALIGTAAGFSIGGMILQVQ